MELRKEVKQGIIKEGCWRAFQFQGRAAWGCDSPEASLTGNLQRNDTVMRGCIRGTAQVKRPQWLAREAGLSSLVTCAGKPKDWGLGDITTVLREGEGKIVLKTLQRGSIWGHKPSSTQRILHTMSFAEISDLPTENYQSNLLYVMVWTKVPKAPRTSPRGGHLNTHYAEFSFSIAR